MAIDTVFALAPTTSLEAVADGAVILRTDTGQLYTCNDTSEAFLRRVDGSRSVRDIAALMVEEYEVGLSELEADLQGLAAELESEGIIAPVS